MHPPHNYIVYKDILLATKVPLKQYHDSTHRGFWFCEQVDKIECGIMFSQ